MEKNLYEDGQEVRLYCHSERWAKKEEGINASFTTTLRASRYIDIEHTLQALRPEPAPDLIRGHGMVVMFGRLVFIFMTLTAFAALGGRHMNTMFTVWRENSMQPCQVYPWLGHQRRQLGDGIHRSKMTCVVPSLQGLLSWVAPGHPYARDTCDSIHVIVNIARGCYG